MNPTFEVARGNIGVSRGARASGVWFSASRRKLRLTKFLARGSPQIVWDNSSGATPELARRRHALPILTAAFGMKELMKTTHWIIGSALAIFLSAGANTRGANLFDDSRMSTLPPAVYQTVKSVMGSGRLSDLVLTNENGVAVYEVEMRLRGVDRSFTVATDGSLVARQVFLKELPPAVLATVQRETAKGNVETLYWLNEDGDPAYYVEFTKGGKDSWLLVAPDGWVTSRPVDLAAQPAPVRAAIREKLEGRAPTEVARAVEGDEVTFEVTDTVKGRERLWIFQADGTVLAEPLWLNAVPSQARATLTRQSAGGRVIHVFKILHDGATLYEVLFVRQDVRRVCTVNAEGQIHSEEIPLTELPQPLQTTITAKVEGRFIVRIEMLPAESGVIYAVTLRRQEKIEELRFAADGSLIPKPN